MTFDDILLGLEPNLRDVLGLAVFHGMRSLDIAGALRLTDATVRFLLARALRRLRFAIAPITGEGDHEALVALYVIDALEPDEAACVERAIAASARMAASSAGYREVVARLASTGRAIAPSPHMRARLLAASITHEIN